MASDPQQVQQVFLAAVECPAARRAAFLERECGADADLRRRIEALLAAHDASGSFLDSSPSAPITEATGAYTPHPDNESPLPAAVECRPAAEPGTVIAGRYKLVEPVGEGGMGAVWLAQQTEPVRRLVAIKLIKAGMDSKAVLARFEAERQALALMDHPNIAKVLDAGAAPDGRPFFVMELVKGVPITKFCDDRRLTPRQRLELFVPVCQAVQHAHQKGIIHRDIKPSNVLVVLYDDKPVPKVIDFGVAKAAGPALTDLTLVTGFGAVVGTPEYMSPEQASFNQLDIDTRSDVYSLGVLLYELLTGTTPFPRKDLERTGLLEILRLIREQEPPKPSTRLSSSTTPAAVAAARGTDPRRLAGMVRGELDWIVMKALEKDRGRRYETANGLAADVQRYLAGEPVQAVPPSAAYRLRKFVRRHRGPLAAAAVVFLALIAGIAGTAWQWAHAVDARKAADQRAEGEKNAKDELWENLYVSRAAQIQTAWDAGLWGRLRDLLAAQVPTAGQRDLRGFEWYYLDRQLHADLRTVDLPKTLPDQIGPISPDGTRVLRYVTKGDTTWMKLFDTSTGREGLAIPLPGDAARDATFSPDGKWIVAGVRDDSPDGFGKPTYLRRWDATTGEEDVRIREVLWGGIPWSGPNGVPVLCREPGWRVGFGSPETTYAFGLWDGQGVKKVKTFLPRTAGEQALSPDGTVLVVSGTFGVALVDVRTAKVTQTLPVQIGDRWSSPWGSLVVFSPDGGRIAVVGETLTVWESATGRKVLEVRERAQSPVFSPDLTRIAYLCQPSYPAPSAAAQARIVDAATGEVRRSLRGQEGNTNLAMRGGITDLAFSRDGTELITVGGNLVKHWDATLDERVPALKERGRDSGLVLGFKSKVNPDATRAFVAGVNGFVVWGRGEKPVFTSPPSRVKFGGISGPPGLPLPGGGPPLKPMSPPPGVKDDPKTAKPAAPGPPVFMGVTGPGEGGLSADGRQVFWWNNNGAPDGDKFKQESELQLWDPDAGRQLVEVVREGKFLWVQLSPDGRRLAAAVEPPGEVILWDAESGRELCRRPLPHGREFKLVFSPDGRRLAALGSEEGAMLVGLWNAEDGQPLPSANVPYEGKPQYTIFLPAFDAEAKRIAVPLNTAGGIVRVWDVATGSHVVDLKGVKGLGQISHLAFSPDGHRLAMVSDQKVRLWDPDTGTELLAITPEGFGIEHLTFSADGHAIDLVVQTAAGFETRRLDATPRE